MVNILGLFWVIKDSHPQVSPSWNQTMLIPAAPRVTFRDSGGPSVEYHVGRTMGARAKSTRTGAWCHIPMVEQG